MLGAIIGDMVGSLYEFGLPKTKNIKLFNLGTRLTDDSLLTLAVAETLMKHYPIKYNKESLRKIQNDLVESFINTYKENKNAGFGMLFIEWAKRAVNGDTKPYNSYGNGSAMRISPVGWIANSEKRVKQLSKTVTEITHNHPEGLKGAEAIAMCIYLALHGSTKEQIKERVIKCYYPEIKNFKFDELVKNNYFNPTCQHSVPQAIYCFLISNGLEDTIRNCVAIGGDCDTTAAMAGSIAEAYYNKEKLSKFEERFLYFMIDPDVEMVINKFYKTIGNKKLSEKNKIKF